MLALIAGIGSVVHLVHARWLTRWGQTALWFSTILMCGFVLGDHLLVTYACWEVMSMLSLFLTSRTAGGNKVLRDGLLMWSLNQLGSSLLLVGVLCMGQCAHTFSLQALSTQWLPSAATYRSSAVTLLLLGVGIKSAQFPVSVWLRRAAHAPVPVSALLHTVGLVGCGVHLLARLYPILDDFHRNVLVAMGSLTALIGSYVAWLQTERKALLAYSTAAHIGVVLAGIGSGRPSAGLHYFAQHAFCKACLFLCTSRASCTQNYLGDGPHTPERTDPRLWKAHITVSYLLLGLPIVGAIQPKHSLLEGVVAWANLQSPWAWSLPVALASSTLLTSLYLGELCPVLTHTSRTRTSAAHLVSVRSAVSLTKSAVILAGAAVTVTVWGEPQWWLPENVRLADMTPGLPHGETGTGWSTALHVATIVLFAKGAVRHRLCESFNLKKPRALGQSCLRAIGGIEDRGRQALGGLIASAASVEAKAQLYAEQTARWWETRAALCAVQLERCLTGLSRCAVASGTETARRFQMLTQRGNLSWAVRWTALLGGIVGWVVGCFG